MRSASGTTRSTYGVQGGSRAAWNAIASSLYLTSRSHFLTDCFRFFEHLINSQSVFDLIECLNSVCQEHAFFE